MLGFRRKEPNQSQQTENSVATGTTNTELEALAREAAAAAVTESQGNGAEIVEADVETVPTDPRALHMILGLGSKLAAKRLGAHWELEKDEVEALSAAAAPVFDKYMPNVMGKYSLEAALLITVIGVYSSISARAHESRGKEAGHLDNNGTAGRGEVNATA